MSIAVPIIGYQDIPYLCDFVHYYMSALSFVFWANLFFLL